MSCMCNLFTHAASHDRHLILPVPHYFDAGAVLCTQGGTSCACLLIRQFPTVRNAVYAYARRQDVVSAPSPPAAPLFVCDQRPLSTPARWFEWNAGTVHSFRPQEAKLLTGLRFSQGRGAMLSSCCKPCELFARDPPFRVTRELQYSNSLLHVCALDGPIAQPAGCGSSFWLCLSTTSLIFGIKSVIRNGFGMTSSMPASCAFLTCSGRAYAVTAMMGMCLVMVP